MTTTHEDLRPISACKRERAAVRVVPSMQRVRRLIARLGHSKRRPLIQQTGWGCCLRVTDAALVRPLQKKKDKKKKLSSKLPK